MSRDQQNGTKSRESDEIQQLRQRVKDLEQKLAAGQTRSAGLSDHLDVEAVELPADYKGHLPRLLHVSLRPDLRRVVIALHRHLTETHAQIQHPRYHDQTRHVDDMAHVLVWILERVRLTGKAEPSCQA